MDYDDPMMGPTFRFNKDGLIVDFSCLVSKDRPGWPERFQCEYSWERLEEYRQKVLSKA